MSPPTASCTFVVCRPECTCIYLLKIKYFASLEYFTRACDINFYKITSFFKFPIGNLWSVASIFTKMTFFVQFLVLFVPYVFGEI